MTPCPHGRSPFATCGNCGRWWTEAQLTRMCELLAAQILSRETGSGYDLVSGDIARLIAEAQKPR